MDALLAANPDLNKVILLSHMQQLSIELALAERLEGVDIIVAGGSNTRLFDDNDRARDGDSDQGQYPQFVTNAGGTTTAVVNTDGNYKYVGRLVIDFDEDGNILADSYDQDISGAFATDDQGVADLGAESLIDPEIDAITDAIQGRDHRHREQCLRRLGRVPERQPLGHVHGGRPGRGAHAGDQSRQPDRGRQPRLRPGLRRGRGDLDQERRRHPGQYRPGGGAGGRHRGRAHAERGDPRCENGNVVKPEGGISQNDIATTLAFNNGLTLLDATRAELVAFLEGSIGALPGGSSGGFPQIAGLKFSFDETQPVGDRVISAGVFDGDVLVAELVRDGEITGDATESFRIVTLNFLANSGDPVLSTLSNPNRVDLIEPGRGRQ